MTSKPFLAIAFLIASTALAANDFKLEKDFERLDNGKDLGGWTEAEGWSVVDGAIHLDAKKAKGNLSCKKNHSDSCVIRLQFRATPNADSGVYFYGKQFQVRDYPKAGPKEYAKPAKPAGEWNEMEFDFASGVAVVKLNGEVIEKSWKIGTDPKKVVALQRERGDFDFRFIRIKEKNAKD